MRRQRYLTIALVLLSGLVSCNQDPYNKVKFLDDANNSDGFKWTDAFPRPDGYDPTVDAGELGDFKGGGDVLSYDACAAIQEVCNNVDDNCDNRVDEGFETLRLTDPRFCEDCKGCMGLLEKHAYPECSAGSCEIDNCMTGFVNLDGKSDNGCEYECVKTGVEVCDGVDNDCDGTVCTKDSDCKVGGTCGPDGHCVDEGVVLNQSFCKTIGPCQGAKAACKGALGWQCQYSSDVELQPCFNDSDCGTGNRCIDGVCPGVVINDERKCDNIDGDCDNVVDDPWNNNAVSNPLGSECEIDATKIGACRPKGKWSCNNSHGGVYCKQVQAGAAPKNEICNGIDDDCDGKVDEENDDAAGKGVVDKMVLINRTVGGKNYRYYIYSYEASRPDASNADVGELATRACSRSDVVPWNNVTYSEAQAACAASGKRLCSAVEWSLACQGKPATIYPYGNTYKPNACNGVNFGDEEPKATGSLTNCEGGVENIFDMSGNLREWTAEQNGTTSGSSPKKIYVMRGGAFHTPWPGLACDFDLSLAVEDVVLPANGFRCCSDSAP